MKEYRKPGEAGRQAAQAVSNIVNARQSEDIDVFVEYITNDHRTLQQNTFRVIMKCLNAWKLKAEILSYDLRNEQTCKLSRDMLDAIDDRDHYIPFV